MQCSQCPRTAMYDVGGHFLCIEHYTMVSNNARESQAQSAAMINYLRDSIDATFGLPPQGPRLQVPQPIIQNAPVTYNHINVDRSVIGSINNAQVGRIEVAMNNIKNNGDNEVSEALKELTEAIINSNEIQIETRNQLVEQLAFISEQAILPGSQQQKSVIKLILNAIPTAISTVASITTLWLQIQPILLNNFK